MRNFTDADIKEMLKYLNRHHSQDNGYVECVIQDIDEWAYEHELVNDVKVEAFLCEQEKIESGWWEWGGVDIVPEKDYGEKCYIIDIAYEDSVLTVYVATPAKEEF